MAGWLENILGNILKHRLMASHDTLRLLAVLLAFTGFAAAPVNFAVAQMATDSGMLVAPAAVVVPTPTTPIPDLRVDPYRIAKVPVDVTAGSVTEAREVGLTQARVDAFRMLINRMTLRENAATITMPSTTQIIDMVLEFSVSNERSSAVRYLADLSVRFNPNAVRNFLRSQNVPFAETASRPLVVIPVLQEEGTAQLWQDTNPWRDAWAKIIPHDGLVPFVLPLGDLDDITLLSADQALAKDAAALKRVADKYGASGAMVAIASASSSNPNVSVVLSEVRPLGTPWEGRAGASQAADQTREDTFVAAALDSARAVEDGWKQRNILRFGEGGQLTALIPINALNDWLAVKARLAQVPVVEKVDLKAMNKNLVQATVTFAGDETQLQFAMGQHDLELAKDGDIWMLRAPSRAAAPVLVDPMAAEPSAIAVE